MRVGSRGVVAMLITLSGLDGAGKSTLAEALRANLVSEGTAAVVLHMNKQVGLYAYVRTIRDAFLRLLRGRNTSPGSTADKAAVKPSTRAQEMLAELRYRIIWGKSLRRFVDLVDLLTFQFYRFYLERVRGRVIIMDRYFYDRMADLADGRRWQYLRWFSRIVPVPDVAVFIDVPPEEAFARKGEFSVEAMRRRRETYREIFGWVPGSAVIPNDDRDRALKELESVVAERLGRRGQRAVCLEP